MAKKRQARKQAPARKRAPKVEVQFQFRKAPKGTFADVAAAVSGAGFTVTPLATEGEGVPKAFPGYLEARLKEDANADAQVRQILKETAHVDLRSTRAAQLAYSRPGDSILVPATSNPERHIIDQLVDNLLRQERAAVIGIIREWATVYEVTADAVYQLKKLILRVRGEADREIVDNTATGHYTAEPDGEDGDFLPFRGTMAKRAWKPATELALAE